jgi:hypothetical protein
MELLWKIPIKLLYELRQKIPMELFHELRQRFCMSRRQPPDSVEVGNLPVRGQSVYTDKKNQIFLIYKKIQRQLQSHICIRKDFLIYEEMRKYFPIYEEEAVSHI